MTLLPLLAVVVFAAYQLAMFAVALRRWPRPSRPGPSPLFVFVLPCRDEELVIGASLDRLRQLPEGDWLAIVVDDASTDATADIIAGYAERDPRIRLLRRRLPDARKGKGAALNAAYRELERIPRVAALPAQQVFVVVLDADGRIDPMALAQVTPYLSDPRVGGAQIGVRIRNAPDSALARLQDVEFVAYTGIFQRARRWWGTAGLGGNGQFTRLSALRSLGARPWSDCLTEDLELGVRLITAGWRIVYVPETWVAQQGLRSFAQLVRQRSRWFHGTLQCLGRIPDLLESRATSAGRAADVAIHITLPLLLLSMTFPAVAFWVAGVARAVATPVTEVPALLAGNAWTLIALYVVGFGPGWLYGLLYRRAGGVPGLVPAVLWGHAFVVYAYLWLPAGWWAVWRAVAGRAAWAKTRRLAEVPVVVGSEGEA